MIQAMSQPFQCLYKYPGKNNILAAASGSCIYCFDIASENLVSVLILQQDQENSLKKAVNAEIPKTKDAIINGTAPVDSIRPSKRQKLSSLDDGSATSTGPLFENDDKLETDPSIISQPSSAIIKLTGSRNGRYLIAVTDDKCIRVLEFLQDNSLEQLSERYKLTHKSSTSKCGR